MSHIMKPVESSLRDPMIRKRDSLWREKGQHHKFAFAVDSEEYI